MIYDTFLFNGELDLLEIRLNILGDVVDKFVICEARQYFNGEPHESFYLANKERFKKWEDKIIHYQFDLMEDKALVEQARASKNTLGNPYWMKVYYAMEMMRKPLEGCKDEDIIFISDVDEIWNLKFFEALAHYKDDRVYGLKQLVYYYQLNNRCSEDWTGTIVTTYKRLKIERINDIKQKGELKILNGGWHFTYQQGEEAIRRKIVSSRTLGEQDKTDSYYGIPTEVLMDKIKQGQDFFGRDYKFWVEEENWPDYLKQNRQKYLKMLK